jgi:FkbM family methyltransferase
VFRASRDYRAGTRLFAIEPNPKLVERLQKIDDCTVIPKVVWTHDGSIGFYYDTRKSGLRSTAIPNSGSTRCAKEPTVVACMDFSKWLYETFRPDDRIIVKMDIEGAEYEVLRRMLEDGSIAYVHKLYLETHRRKSRIGRGEHKALMDRLAAISGLELGESLESTVEGYEHSFRYHHCRLGRKGS